MNQIRRTVFRRGYKATGEELATPRALDHFKVLLDLRHRKLTLAIQTTHMAKNLLIIRVMRIRTRTSQVQSEERPAIQHNNNKYQHL